MKYARWISMIVLFLSTATQAQLTKGVWLVGGSGSFESHTRTFNYQSTGFPDTRGTAKYTNIDLNSTIGFFVLDNLALGITPTVMSYQGATFDGAEIVNGRRFAVGPFGRYYLLNKEKPYNILTEIIYQVGMNFSSSRENNRGKFNNFSVKAGPEIFFNSTVGLEVLLGYQTTTITIENSPAAFSNINSGFEISVGFQIHLEKI